MRAITAEGLVKIYRTRKTEVRPAGRAPLPQHESLT